MTQPGQNLNILISSGGRRAYLVRWFQEALARNGVNGRVVLADCDPYAPATAFADAYLRPPLVSEPAYDAWLERTLQDEEISLAISVNDFELSRWSSLPIEPVFAPLVRLAPTTHRMLEDKLMARVVLEKAGVLSPLTFLAADALKLRPHELAWLIDNDEVVVKGRYGSGSRGLQFSTVAELPQAVAAARCEVTDREGTRPATPAELDELIIVQPHIRGQEYGVDVIADFAGDYVAPLPRKKLAMRGGETDHAETAPASEFAFLAANVSAATGHRGIIDLDLIRDEEGRDWVIDINPRFGGGYPFSHAGGADVPAAYVAWALGRKPQPEWVESEPGVFGAKLLDVLRVPGETSKHALVAEEGAA